MYLTQHALEIRNTTKVQLLALTCDPKMRHLCSHASPQRLCASLEGVVLESGGVSILMNNGGSTTS